MGIDNIRMQRKGDGISAGKFNAIMDRLKNSPVTSVNPGGLPNSRPQTLFYTESDIPAYSIFPLIAASAGSTNNTFNAQYNVEQYNEEHVSDYMEGYFGTNGRYPVYANTAFYGQIISQEYDTPIKVSDYSVGEKQCGFKNNSWEATVDATGMSLNGRAPHANGCCYVRRLLSDTEFKDKKFIGLCESTTSGAHFTKCGFDGNRLTYDTDEQIVAELPPYIEAVQQGGYYLIDWFTEYDRWVVVAGTCAEDNREYQPFTTVNITYHIKDGEPSGSDPQSGTAASFLSHDEFATMTQKLIWRQDLVNYPGRSANLFFSEPTFALNSSRDKITFDNLKLNAGAAGIYVYQFVITNCNGSCRDVYTVAFKCTETNDAPEVTMETTNITLHLDGDFDEDIGTIVEHNDDTCVIYDLQTAGDTSILTSYDLTIDSSNNIHLSLKASDCEVGSCLISFYVDDSHDLKATDGEYEKITLRISVTNDGPNVKISHGSISQKVGTTETYTIGTVSDPEDDNMSIADFRISGDSISSASVTIDGDKLKATITLKEDATTKGYIYFKVEDEFGVYSSASPVEQHIDVTPIPDPDEEESE